MSSAQCQVSIRTVQRNTSFTLSISLCFNDVNIRALHPVRNLLGFLRLQRDMTLNGVATEAACCMGAFSCA